MTTAVRRQEMRRSETPEPATSSHRKDVKTTASAIVISACASVQP